MNQHVRDMYPDSSLSRAPAHIVEPQTTPTGNETAMRMTSPDSQGYNSLDDLHHDSNDSNKSGDNDQEVQSTHELTPLIIKTEEAVGNYSDFDDEPNNESQFDTGVEYGDSTIGERTGDKENRKRSKANTAVFKKREKNKRASRASEFGHSSHSANDDNVVIIDDDDGDDKDGETTEILPSSSRKSNKAGMYDADDALLNELDDVSNHIFEGEEQLKDLQNKLKKLKEQKDTIRTKIRNAMKVRNNC